ncbi:hypothetical protein AALO_G00293840 [Alosa alosa]|uniref:Uncharacterized protein n=1 Tax=Alosa alosa TaxID=278164 RepID=A0AAV6FHG9_9TELE|nr:hypothetical protein AALO_G00293840 [Alosa alosa]
MCFDSSLVVVVCEIKKHVCVKYPNNYTFIMAALATHLKILCSGSHLEVATSFALSFTHGAA